MHDYFEDLLPTEEEQTASEETENADIAPIAPKKNPQKRKKPNGMPPSQKMSRQDRIKKRRKAARAQLLAVLIVFLAFYLLFSLFIGAWILYSFKNSDDSSEIYALHVVYDEHTLHKLKAKDVNTDYGLYIPFEYLSEIGSFGISGDGDSARLFIIGTDNMIELTKNSSLVIINGNPVRISAPVLFEENDYLLPVVLVENFITGIDVSYDDKKMICRVSSDVRKSDVAFKLALPEPHPIPDYFTDEDRYYPIQNESDTSDENQ